MPKVVCPVCTEPASGGLCAKSAVGCPPVGPCFENVKGDGWSEEGCVVDIDDDEINMTDGKEGWCVDREEIESVSFK